MLGQNYCHSLNLKEVAPYILQGNFFTPEYCEYLLHACKRSTEWTTNEEDKYFSTKDLEFQKTFPSLYKSIAIRFHEKVTPLVAETYSADLGIPYSIFCVRYRSGSQTSLQLHNDDSYVTGSIKLNNDYEGAELEFPEHGFSNKDVPVGDILLWPASITHKHHCSELISGEKYSLTIWTDFPKIGKLK